MSGAGRLSRIRDRAHAPAMGMGQGYAREGAAAALDFARKVLRHPEITSIIRPANTGSIRVATSPGAIPSETVEFFGAVSVLYRYPGA